MPDSPTARCQTCGMHGGHKMQCPQRTDAGLRVAVDGSALPAPAAGEPELPEPKWHDCTSTNAAHMPYFTADQLRAYGQAMAEHARREAMEEAAKLCDKLSARALGAQAGPADALSNVMLRQVAHLGHDECAAAIRAAAPPQGEPK